MKHLIVVVNIFIVAAQCQIYYPFSGDIGKLCYDSASRKIFIQESQSLASGAIFDVSSSSTIRLIRNITNTGLSLISGAASVTVGLCFFPKTSTFSNQLLLCSIARTIGNSGDDAKLRCSVQHITGQSSAQRPTISSRSGYGGVDSNNLIGAMFEDNRILIAAGRSSSSTSDSNINSQSATAMIVTDSLDLGQRANGNSFLKTPPENAMNFDLNLNVSVELMDSFVFNDMIYMVMSVNNDLRMGRVCGYNSYIFRSYVELQLNCDGSQLTRSQVSHIKVAGNFLLATKCTPTPYTKAGSGACSLCVFSLENINAQLEAGIETCYDLKKPLGERVAYLQNQGREQTQCSLSSRFRKEKIEFKSCRMTREIWDEHKAMDDYEYRAVKRSTFPLRGFSPDDRQQAVINASSYQLSKSSGSKSIISSISTMAVTTFASSTSSAASSNVLLIVFASRSLIYKAWLDTMRSKLEVYGTIPLANGTGSLSDFYLMPPGPPRPSASAAAAHASWFTVVGLINRKVLFSVPSTKCGRREGEELRDCQACLALRDPECGWCDLQARLN